MGLLGRSSALAFILATGCYSPDLRDCTVTCASENDCAAGQVCGSDRFCAAPDIAGRCESLPAGDAGVRPMRDAGRPVDAAVVTPDAPPDGPPPPPTTTIHVKIDGKGRVSIANVGICDKDGPQAGDCAFVVPLGTAQTAQATPYEDQRFDKWATLPCSVEPSPTCNFTAIGPTLVQAKFRKDD